MSALKFKIEKPEDKARRKRNFKIACYSVVGLIGVLALLGLFWYVTLDRLPPEITLTSPEDNFVTQKSKVSLKYDVKDDSEVDCKVFLNDKVVEGEAELKPGVNTWKVYCVDKGYYKKEATSKERKITFLTPLKFDKLELVEAPELTKGVLKIYEGTSKKDLGSLLFEILPNNEGLIKYNKSTGKHLSISLWGKTFVQKQKIKLNNVSVDIPEITNITGTFALYIDAEGNTYHSRKDHKYPENSSIDLNVEDALALEHRANK